MLRGKSPNPQMFQDILDRYVGGIEFTKGKTNALIKRWVVNLNVAGNQTVNLAGNFVYGFEATDGQSVVNIQFSRKDVSTEEEHPCVLGFGFMHPFDKLHLRWDAQAGETITLLIGNLAPDLFGIIDNRSAVESTALLQDVVDELQGDLAPEGMAVVPVGAVATQIVAQNANRRSVMVGHRYDGVGFIYVGFTNLVTALVHCVRLAPDEYYTVDDYRGAIWAIRSAGATNAVYGEV